MKTLKELRAFIILWLTQAFSSLGSAMTSFALTIQLYNDSGSALQTALLTVCSYAPYVIMSIFAGAISDKWSKKGIMLVCDSFAALCAITVLVLLRTGTLAVWHLYVLNALNGLMNTVQAPASEVAATLLTPKQHYQKTGGMRYFSNSVVSILTPVLAAAVVSFAGIEAVIAFDLLTFATAFLVLLLFIRIPKIEQTEKSSETLLQSAGRGIAYLREHRGILYLILFLSVINLIASFNNAALPAMVLSKSDNTTLGIVSSCTGIATLIGSMIATFFPKPKSRSRVICNCLLFSMCTENYILAMGEGVLPWSIATFCGWILIPLMGANYDVLFRSHVPKEMQGRVYSVRNTLQFFTIPLGYFLGGLLVDAVFEPLMARIPTGHFLTSLFGSGKGSGAAMLFFLLGIAGTVACLGFRRLRAIKKLDANA